MTRFKVASVKHDGSGALTPREAIVAAEASVGEDAIVFASVLKKTRRSCCKVIC